VISLLLLLLLLSGSFITYCHQVIMDNMQITELPLTCINQCSAMYVYILNQHAWTADL
jgi:hypothetical protein